MSNHTTQDDERTRDANALPSRPWMPTVEASDAGEPLLTRAKRILSGDIRPDDYLRLPSPAAVRVEREFELVQAMRPGSTLTDGARARVRTDRTLEHHFGGQVVACLRTAAGVIVLAAGEEAIAALVQAVPGSDWKGVAIEFPEPL